MPAQPRGASTGTLQLPWEMMPVTRPCLMECQAAENIWRTWGQGQRGSRSPERPRVFTRGAGAEIGSAMRTEPLSVLVEDEVGSFHAGEEGVPGFVRVTRQANGGMIWSVSHAGAAQRTPTPVWVMNFSMVSVFLPWGRGRGPPVIAAEGGQSRPGRTGCLARRWQPRRAGDTRRAVALAPGGLRSFG